MQKITSRVGRERHVEQSQGTLWFAARASAFAALCVFGMQPFAASAQATLPIAAAPDAAARATLGTSSNGTQVVNIVAPTAAGVSNNVFSQFNVGTAGIIVNNATQTAQTQIGGVVQGNAALGNQGARVILMQVNSGAPSQLLGTTEIAGKSANLVLANPAGISCSGCGFLNAPRVSLATGTATLAADGSLAGFDVKQGRIAVDGKGLDAKGSAIDLVARAMTINGKVQAQSIDAIAGANRVDYASKNVTAQNGTGEKPQVAIDVQALGSMYGDGAVRLVGTEAGLGVRDSGAVNSVTGSINVSANGDVTIGAPARLKAATDVSLSGASVSNAGAIEAARGVDLRASQLTNSGSVSGGDVSVVGQQALVNSGTVNAARNATFAGDRLTIEGGSVKAAAIAMNAQSMQVSRGEIAAGQSLDVRAGTLENHGVLTSAGDAQITAQTGLTNAGGKLAAQRSLTIETSALDNSNGTVQATQGTLGVRADRVVNNAGSMRGGDSLSLDAQDVNNAKGAISADNIRVIARGDVDNSNGSMVAAKNLDLNAQGGLRNAAGSVKAGDALSVNASMMIDNRSGVLMTDRGALRLSAREVQNANNGSISSGGTLGVHASQLTNDGGSISAKDYANLQVAGELSNRSGTIRSETIVSGTAGSLSNEGGTIAAPDGAHIATTGGNGGQLPPTPTPAPADTGFNPGPGYVRVAPADYDPNRYQSGFFGPDGYFYGYIGGVTMSAMR
ncbi:filamentous hemagglutinin N-terminal domain-containing protein [Caballeronia cordobensis]|uniref:two-partner secretion domain-containing protein n=1 Tax=Caballeronia cordobensis TaxID=1353886 RepID=UPI00045EE3BF|nr:filamentous haemagglutinin family outer membrane protein precursor [Burkholderia sp. RPE67]